MGSVIKLEALRGLESAIVAGIPALAGNTTIVQEPPDQKVRFPSLAIIPAGSPRFRFCYDQVHSRPTSSSIVAQVGTWEGSLQIRLAHANMHKRYEIQQEIENLFLQREGAPGVLLTTITTVDNIADFLVSWDMDDGGWEEEFAFSSQEWAVTTLDYVIPALVRREGVFSIEDLRLGVTTDFNVPATSVAFDGLAHKYRINDDGTVTPI